jgi:hypothetical protein
VQRGDAIIVKVVYIVTWEQQQYTLHGWLLRDVITDSLNDTRHPVVYKLSVTGELGGQICFRIIHELLVGRSIPGEY